MKCPPIVFQRNTQSHICYDAMCDIRKCVLPWCSLRLAPLSRIISRLRSQLCSCSVARPIISAFRGTASVACAKASRGLGFECPWRETHHFISSPGSEIPTGAFQINFVVSHAPVSCSSYTYKCLCLKLEHPTVAID